MTAAAIVTCSLLLTLGAVAAFTDLRRGLIPNWLTLPPLLLVPPVQGLFLGPGALGSSLLGVFVCGAVPLMIFLRGGMGGGDVKLLAAVGAVAGARLGLEIQLTSYMIATLIALCTLAHRGHLLTTVARAPRAVAGAASASGVEIRLGLPVLLAVVAILGSHWVLP